MPIRILNCNPSQDTANDWKIAEAIESGAVPAEVRLPQAVDLRAEWWTVGDQGATGSCVGWALADSVLRWHFVQDGRMTQDQTLSARFVWLAAKETDEFTARPTTFIEREGTSLKAALDVARNFGVVPEAMLPFGGGAYQGAAKTFYATASRLRINAYFNMGSNMDDWRSWLATQGPLLARLDVDEAWEHATDTNGNLDAYTTPGRGGHAVAIVGYTADRLIVRNSWGVDWGALGFAYAAPAYARLAFNEVYGITVYDHE